MLYRAYYSHGKMSYKGKNIAAVFGMISILSSVIKKLEPNQIYICWDAGKNKRRLELVPEYKAGRGKLGFDYENFNWQKESLLKLLDSLGLNQIIKEKFEADDWIYYLVRKFKKDKNNKIYIVSKDKDFDQLISKRVYVWDDQSNTLLHEKNLEKIKGYKPEHVVDYLCLIGDKSDNIPGYGGIGPVKASGILKDHGSIKEYLKFIFLERDGMHGKVIGTELKKLYERNQEMICLKTFYVKNLKGKIKLQFYNEAMGLRLNKKKFIKLSKPFGFKKFVEPNFLKIFKNLNTVGI